MKVSTVTGAYPRSYIQLTAESIKECAALVELHNSKLVPRGLVEIFTQEDWAPGGTTVYSRIYFGEPNARTMYAATKAATDTSA